MYDEKSKDRIGEERLNNQGCLMKIIEYNDAKNITVLFQDKYNAKVHTAYGHFLSGKVRNPYYPSVYNVGIVGSKYPIKTDGKDTKEYATWRGMLQRCFYDKFKIRRPTYKDVTCCDEWLLFENFYEWLHSQENFDKWLVNEKWCLDKDIIVKGNKIYSPETCTLVPHNVNNLFVKNNAVRGDLPIGINKDKRGNWKYEVKCKNPFLHKAVPLGSYSTIKEAFQVYKEYKESVIKQVAEFEYDRGNITKQCYKAMINYEVEITD